MLIADRKNNDSSHDFGKDIIPTMLQENRILHAYQFKGYWKDVGTIDSLWEANMDLIKENAELDLNDKGWKIYTEDTNTLPHFIGPNAKIRHAMITQGCLVDGEVSGSVLFTAAQVKTGAKVIDSVLMPGSQVDSGAVVTRAIVADGVHIGPGVKIGSADSPNILLVAKNVKGEEADK